MMSNNTNDNSTAVLRRVQRPLSRDLLADEEFYRSLPVFDMFPLSNGEDNHVYAYALLYAGLFLFGVCGNVSVVTLIRHVHSNIPYENTMIYVLFLCCVDLASIVPLPMAIMDQLLGFWMFGTIFCKLYRALEHVGRALSTFVLAAMAFDRFLRVCYPHKKISRRVVVLQLTVLSVITFILLSPLLIKASSEEIVLKEVLLENPYRLARVRIFKCMDHLEGTFLALFIMYMFLVGFFLPVILIILFYSLMMRKLIIRSRILSSSKLPLNRIAIYTIAISVFFVFCWSPYWCSMLYLNSLNWNEDPEKQEETFSSEQFIYIMYGIHALPYVNSASNWLLYGLLNSQLMRRAKAKPNQELVCGPATATGFFASRWASARDDDHRGNNNNIGRSHQQPNSRLLRPSALLTAEKRSVALSAPEVYSQSSSQLVFPFVTEANSTTNSTRISASTGALQLLDIDCDYQASSIESNSNISALLGGSDEAIVNASNELLVELSDTLL